MLPNRDSKSKSFGIVITVCTSAAINITYSNICYYEGRSINKLQNNIILLIFKIWKFGNIRFVGNLIGDIHWNFYDDDVTNCDVISTQNPVSQCSILPSSFLLQLASVKQHASCEKVNKFYKQTCLNIKHKRFTFQRIVQIHLIIYRITRRSDRMRESTAANVASVIEKIRRPGCPSPTNFYDYRQTFYTKHVLLVL